MTDSEPRQVYKRDSAATSGSPSSDLLRKRPKTVAGQQHDLSAYPKYRSSGVEVAGDVPEHWEVKRLKYLVSINDEVLPETTAPSFRMRYVDIGNVDATHGITGYTDMTFDLAPSRARRVVRHGDTIVSTVRTYLRAIASIRQPVPDTIVSTGFAVLRPRPSFFSGFAYYLLHAASFIDNVVARSVGANYPAIAPNDIGNIPVAVPPLNDQQVASDYLDRETAKIDALVDKKETLVERLEELRTALVSRTVTRGLPPAEARRAGLDPYPRLKPSGVEWLGDVPEHWDVRQIKQCYSLQLGKMLQNASKHASDLKVPYLKAIHVQWNDVVANDVPQMWASTRDVASYGIECDDLLVCEGGEVGRCAIVSGSVAPNCIIQNSVHRVRPRTGLRNKFLEYTLKAMAGTGWINALCDRATISHLTTDRLGTMKMPVPTTQEQDQLVIYLDRETSKIDRATELARKEIELLREYRTRLISDVVTGKVDVRGILGADVEAET